MEKIDFDFEKIKDFKERFCVKEIKEFLDKNKELEGRIIILYGLRRTGKTTIMQQIINDYKEKPEYKNKWVFYQVSKNDSMEDIYKILKKENQKQTKLVCIDEITKVNDFIDNSEFLADIWAKFYGMQIIISGTDSLGFNFAIENALLGRVKRIRTTYIPYAEHSQVLNTTDIKEYIKYGGLMQQGKDDKEVVDYDSAEKYLNSAVADNIIHSIKKSGKNHILLDFTKKELRTIIAKVVELYSGVFNKIKLKEKLKNVTVTNFTHFLENNNDNKYIRTIIMENRSEMIEEFSQIIKANEKILTKFTENTLKNLENYLIEMDLLSVVKKEIFKYNKEINTWLDYSQSQKEYYIIQPAIKYFHLEAAINYIDNNPKYFGEILSSKKEEIKKFIDHQIKGNMLEQIIMFDVSKSLDKNRYLIFKPVFIKKIKNENDKEIEKNLGEYDLFIYDNVNKNYYIFEIKYSKKINNLQDQHLKNSLFIKHMNQCYHKKAISAVLYRGPSCIKANGIIYLNASDFLIEVYKCKDMEMVVNNLVKTLDYNIPIFTSKLKDFNLLTLPKSDEKYQKYFDISKDLIKSNPFEFLYLKTHYLSPTTMAENYMELSNIAINQKPTLLKKVNLKEELPKNYLTPAIFEKYMDLCEIAVNKLPLIIKDINIEYFPDENKYVNLWEKVIHKDTTLIKYLNANNIKNDNSYINLFYQAFKIDENILDYFKNSRMPEKFENLNQLKNKFKSLIEKENLGIKVNYDFFKKGK